MARQRRRRGAGEGSVSKYQAKTSAVVLDRDGNAVLDRDGNPRTTTDRWLIKYTAPDAKTGEPKVFLRRRGRAGGRQPNLPFTSEAAASTELGDVMSEIRSHIHVSPQKVTVAEWLDEWLAGMDIRPSTRSSYAKNIRLHIKPALGHVELQQLTTARLRAFYRQLTAGGRQDHRAGEGLSPRTVRYVHTILKAALSKAVEDGVLVRNPAAVRDIAPSAKAARAAKPEIHPWTGPQLRAFLDWCREAGAAHTVPYWVLAYTGMRRGELLSLRWRDLDVDTGRLAIRRSVGVVKTKGEPEQIIEGPTKSSKARVIDLDADTVEVLRKWRLDRAGLSLQLARDDALIFGTIEGDYLHPERFSARFTEKLAQCRRKLQAAGMDEQTIPPAIHLHDLRHTHASLLLKGGVPVKVVSERLGHASVTITLEIYAHVMPGMQAEAAAAFAAMIGNGAS